MVSLYGRGMVWWFERGIDAKTYTTYRQQMDVTGQKVAALFAEAPDNGNSRWMITHVIGMERWMQSRIKVALGEPFVHNEYDVYRPSQDEDWDKLHGYFVETRQASCELCDALEAGNVDGAMKVLHNDFGEMSVKGWLEYLIFHSENHAKNMWFKLPGWNRIRNRLI